jgi:hypothetical protein
MTDDPIEANPIRYPALIAGHLWAWTRAVELEAARIGGPELPADRQIDTYLFVIALAQALIAAKAIQKATGDAALRRAYNGFLSSDGDKVPTATTIRDILSHFTEYEAGEGHLQTDGFMDRNLNLSTEVGEGTVWLRINQFRVEISSTAVQAAELAEVAFEAERRHRQRNQRPR